MWVSRMRENRPSGLTRGVGLHPPLLYCYFFTKDPISFTRRNSPAGIAVTSPFFQFLNELEKKNCDLRPFYFIGFLTKNGIKVIFNKKPQII